MSTTVDKPWTMPVPEMGDIVIFSKDWKTFKNPQIGFVASEPGDTTISILTFSPAGFATVQNSCHHKNDPALQGDHGWEDLGAWDFAPITKTFRELKAGVSSGRTKSAK